MDGIFEFLKKNKVFTTLIIIVVLFAAMYCFDYFRAKNYEIEVVSISPEEPVADGETPVYITIKLTRGGTPVEGHYMYILPINGGTMQKNRAQTDQNGCVEYIYYPYRASVLMPAQTVTLRVYDESNSVFVIVNANLDFEIDLKEAV